MHSTSRRNGGGGGGFLDAMNDLFGIRTPSPCKDDLVDIWRREILPFYSKL
jgi:hypothetical protein